MGEDKRLKDVIELQNAIGSLVAKLDDLTFQHQARCIEYELLLTAYRNVVNVVRKEYEFPTPAFYKAELDFQLRILDRIVQEENK